MGQEIVYCAKCQSRILGSDFEKGAAVRLESQAYCRACAPPVEEFTPLGSKRLPRPAPRVESTRTARRLTSERRSSFPLAAGIAAGAVLILVLLAVALSGRPAPLRPPPEPRGSPVAEKPPARYRPPSPPAVPARSVAEDLARLDSEIQGYLRKNEHANALMVLEAARKNRPEPGWAAEVERRSGEISRQYEEVRAKAKAEAAVAKAEPPEPKPPDPKPPPPTASASFVGLDPATRGNWKGVYGAEGFEVVEGGANRPAYARVMPDGHATYIWAASTTDPRAPEKADVRERIAACWYSPTAFDLEIELADGLPHRVAIYCLDWDTAERSQTIEVLDAGTGAVLDRRSLASFAQGTYVAWDLKGRVKVRLTRTGIHNSVVSGVFFGPAGGPRVAAPAPPDPGPLLWLPFEEGKGAEAGDLSGRANHGTVRGGASWTEGKAGRALQFDGRDDHVRVPDSASLKLAGTGLTAAAWVYRQADRKGTSTVLARERGKGVQFHLGFRDNTYVFEVETAEGVRAVQGPVAPTLQWVHLAGTYDGTHVRLYLNGAAPIARGYGKVAPLLNEPGSVAVGTAFSGRVDDVRLYARAIPDLEVAGFARGGETGLVGRWRFDEGSGTMAADASPRRHAGTLENGTAWAAGKSGGAGSFDGTDDHVLVPDSPAIAAISSRLTVAAWIFREDDRDGWRPVVTRPRNPDAYEHFWLGFDNNACNFGVDTVSGERSVTGPRAPLRQWSHVAGTYDGTTVRIYVDGKEEAAAPHSGEIRRGNRPLCFGARRNPETGAVGYAFRGLLDEVHLFDRALSAPEVAALASGAPAAPAGGLVGHWKLDSVDQGRTPDDSGSGRAGSLVKSPRPEPGKRDGALSFDGVGAGVRVPHAAALTFTGPFSIAVWVNPAATQAAQPQWAWVEKWGRSPAGGTSGYMLRMDASRKAKFSLASGGSSDQVLSVSAIPAETWTHVAAVFDGSRGHLYVNGKRERSEAMKPKPGENASPLSIGTAPQGGNRFTGALDDVRLYDRALSEGEVASLASDPPK